MARIRDVWVNWFEGEENGYNICPFHEWRSEDRIEVLDQAEVVYVTDRLFLQLENSLEEIPRQLLDAVYKKSALRKNMSKLPLDYCFIATNKKSSLAVDTLGYETPIRKSRLTPRQEKLALEAIEQDQEPQYTDELTDIDKHYHILSPHPTVMHGLTRKERQLKQLLFMAIDQLKSSGFDAEIRYWYTEWSPDKYLDIQLMSKDEAWDRLYDEVRGGWSEDHYALCESLIKGQPFFEKLWDMQHESEMHK
ncbi:hypothetical protein JCM19037_4305 [Geomicrobium sp. JCM 19037]|uniref:DUF3603 family protein n=1 Tax=unclassified Geomicrobium TaxID=2628951 RepID=UPI00045F3575|nr:DUF3603 family protein [Geomicrobium sp. JCM 19037]GAK05778.1 hypothetical protein JCM19037_4305 [Geomicrobium sp. JCM 19037]